MNFFKRALALALATCTLCSAGVMASAAEVDMDDEAPYVNEDGVEIAFTVETDDLGTIEITQAEVDEAAKLVQELIDGGAIEVPDEYTPMPIYGSENVVGNWNTIDYATYLSGQDGLSTSKILKIKDYGLKAKTLADTKAGSLKDACRHFTWNMLSAHDSTVGAARIKKYAHAYEWAHLCADGIASEYKAREKYWKSQGATDFDSKAFTDSCAAFKSLRNARVKEIKNGSYTTFKKYVDEESAMDFWNNQFGRDYGEMNLSFTSNTKIYNVFKDSYNSGELIGYSENIRPGSANHKKVYKDASLWS